ncbi:Hydantoinase/oxoprolinase-domain-containing protein [Leptodontidium sp. MPI-SDFR-AT-0119]|nr:Hydantoinase/oxoprolinase-domain-containing protein [Leptodontidium sp. MPI-SDFR-AT-0119]
MILGTDGFRSGFVGKLEDSAQGAKCEFMQSDGGLVGRQRFNGLRAILSGPAGGVVGFSRTCYDEDDKVPCIGFDMGCLFNAGPQSAGAHPGPACYRKGSPLTVTDANLVLGRLSAEHCPKIFGPNENEPLDFAASRIAFEELTKTINADLKKAGGKLLSVEEVCLGFLNVANESMRRPIGQITESKGHNTGDHNLASFGGAGGQHACEIADRLNIKRVSVHKHASILSAYGMALADTVQEAHEPCSCTMRLANFQNHVARGLRKEGFSSEQISYECYINPRYSSSDTMIMILQPKDRGYGSAFFKEHRRGFSFTLPNRKVLVENLRVRGRANTGNQATKKRTISTEINSSTKAYVTKEDHKSLRVYFEGGWTDAPMLLLKDRPPRDIISGPAMIYDDTDDCLIDLASDGSAPAASRDITVEPVTKDPIQASIMSNRFMGIAEQMGLTLQDTSVSVNIKERLDFSCNETCWLSNTPLAGGTHLPDITVIAPIFDKDRKNISFYTASKGHHAEIEGILPDSMPASSTRLYEEGAQITSMLLIIGTRSLSDNLNDLKAQIAVNTVKARLKKTYEKFNGKPLEGIHHMDDGTGLEGLHYFNAPSAISKSATMYVLCCLINQDIPLDEGYLLPITFNIPAGTILNPSGKAAVCLRNCNVFSFGFGGKDLETGKDVNGFGFVENICGGSGAAEGWYGTSGVHIHMTNPLITNPEVLKEGYPVILNRFVMRPGSEGIEMFNGGTGIIREYEFRRLLSSSIVSEKRVYQPFGMAGGLGVSGKNSLVEKIPNGGERWVTVGGRKDFKVQTGDRVVIETPGGGGWGEAGSEKVCVLRTESGLEERSFVTPF